MRSSARSGMSRHFSHDPSSPSGPSQDHLRSQTDQAVGSVPLVSRNRLKLPLVSAHVPTVVLETRDDLHAITVDRPDDDFLVGLSIGRKLLTHETLKLVRGKD